VFAGSPNHAKSKSSTVSDAAILHFASPHRRNPGAPSFAVAAATEGWDKNRVIHRIFFVPTVVEQPAVGLLSYTSLSEVFYPMSDGREERKEQEKRRQQEQQEDREDRLQRHPIDPWQPERPDS
jgi:hypothetical protein